MNPASRASQAIEEGLYDRPKSLWSSATEDIEIEPLDTMAGGIKGYVSNRCYYLEAVLIVCGKILLMILKVIFCRPNVEAPVS